jgi:hypothetical protein
MISCLLWGHDAQFGDISNISKEPATSISRVEAAGSSILYSNGKWDHYLGPSVVLPIYWQHPELIPRVQKAKNCSRKAVYSVNLYGQTDTTVTVKHVSCCIFYILLTVHPEAIVDFQPT